MVSNTFLFILPGYKLELENGHYGHVKVTYFNQTGYICMDGFDAADANVICKQIGYLGGKSNFLFLLNILGGLLVNKLTIRYALYFKVNILGHELIFGEEKIRKI